MGSFSCVKYVGPNEKYTVQDIMDNSTVDFSRLIFPSDTIVYFNGEGGITVIPLFGPVKSNWISPGKVFVNGIYPGGMAEHFVVIHNGRDKDSIFKVSCRNVDQFDQGYSKNLPLSWMYISNASPSVKSGETVVVPIQVKIPLEYRGDKQEKMETMISVVDTGKSGNVIVELCSKWLVTTK